MTTEDLEDLLTKITEQGYWQGFPFSSALIESLLKEAENQFTSSQFRQAQIGRGSSKQIESEIRRDQIFWIEDWSKDPYSNYGSFVQDLIQNLKRHLFLPLKRFEGHFARYDQGDFYIKHVDQHKGQPHRAISMVLYLNALSKDQGGALNLYDQEDENSLKAEIQPEAGKLVIFNSLLPHEVKPTHSLRWSIAAWLRTD